MDIRRIVKKCTCKIVDGDFETPVMEVRSELAVATKATPVTLAMHVHNITDIIPTSPAECAKRRKPTTRYRRSRPEN